MTKQVSSTEKRDQAIEVARDVLANPNTVFLDTETTGFSKDDVVIELATLAPLVDHVAINCLFKHERYINPNAQKVHGITQAMTNSAGLLYHEAHEAVVSYLLSKQIVAYNYSFDLRLLKQTAEVNGCTADEYDNFGWVCAQEIAKNYHGKTIGLGKFLETYQVKGSTQHRALADCRDTLELVKFIASQHTSYELAHEDIH